MATRSTSGKTTTKSKAAAKPAIKAASKSASKSKAPKATKSRLAGPKPPKRTVKSIAPKAPAVVIKPEATAPAADKAPAGPVVATQAEELKKRELVDLVVARSGIKKKDAKPVVEAMLAVLGDTVAQGREMNLQPFGRVKYNRTKETTSARVVVTKIRQSKKQGQPAKGVLAEAAE